MLKFFKKSQPSSTSALPEDNLSSEQKEALNKQFAAVYEQEPNGQKAFEVAHQFAEQGSADAQYLLGVMLENGDGRNTYPEKAADYYYRAAKQDKAEAQYNLALLCMQDALGKPDMLTAVHWFEQASENGIVQATYNLATCYDQGLGCVEDKEAAFKAFCKAAEKSYTPAWQNVAVMLYQGEGCQRNPVESYAWTLLAAKAGIEEAQTMEKHLTQELKSEQILAGKDRLDALVAKYMPN